MARNAGWALLQDFRVVTAYPKGFSRASALPEKSSGQITSRTFRTGDCPSAFVGFRPENVRISDDPLNQENSMMMISNRTGKKKIAQNNQTGQSPQGKSGRATGHSKRLAGHFPVLFLRIAGRPLVRLPLSQSFTSQRNITFGGPLLAASIDLSRIF